MQPLRVLLWLMLLVFAAAVLPPAGLAAEGGQVVVAGKPKPKKAKPSKNAKPKKAYDYEKSRYKFYRVLTAPEPHTYKYDEKGNPILPPSQKKAPKKKEKPKPPAE